MGFLDIGWPELMLILVVVLIVFGPGRMVEISKSLGRTFRALKKASSNLTAQVTREIQEEDRSPGQGEKNSGRTDKLTKS